MPSGTPCRPKGASRQLASTRYLQSLSDLREISCAKLLLRRLLRRLFSAARWFWRWIGIRRGDRGRCSFIAGGIGQWRPRRAGSVRRPRRNFAAGSDRSLFRDLTVIVDVQVETLSVTAGVELERGLGPLELELLKALLGQLAAHTLNTMGVRRSRPSPHATRTNAPAAKLARMLAMSGYPQRFLHIVPVPAGCNCTGGNEPIKGRTPERDRPVYDGNDGHQVRIGRSI